MRALLAKLAYGLLTAAAILALPVALRPAIAGEPKTWVLVLLGVLATVFQPAYRATEGSRTREDRGSAVQIVWTVYLTQLLAVLEAALLRYPESFRFDAAAAVAGVLMFAGLALRTWGFKELGAFFTWNVEIVEGQQIVETGPYRFIRHPGYAGAWLTYLAAPFFLHSYYTAALTAVALPIAFIRRIRLEEALLRRTFPEYDAYAARTRALIPWLY